MHEIRDFSIHYERYIVKLNSSAHITILALAASFSFVSTAQAARPREVEVLNKATVSLVQATQIAEKQAAGKTIGAEFDIEKDRPLWEIKILGNAGVKEYKIDAASGAVIKIEDEHIRGKLTNFMTGMNMKDLESAKTSLAQAVATAEKKFNGRAVKVQVEHERGSIQYDVFVRTGDKSEKIKIDATGQAR